MEQAKKLRQKRLIAPKGIKLTEGLRMMQIKSQVYIPTKDAKIVVIRNATRRLESEGMLFEVTERGLVGETLVKKLQ